MDKLTLGSLFDGIGGFPLGGLLCGIEPLWASEVEPFPIRVTTKRLPQVKHLGDINIINGADIPPADIITGGFPCQNLSVAGQRAGLHGERSGLFFQMTRIIREMREASGNKYPRFVVIENVPGMYSSNKGQDFREVLNKLVQIKDKTLSVPMPEKDKWLGAGEIVGDGFSIAYRTLDAQHFGVAQRRRRCYLVVDFASERAGKILFESEGVSGYHPKGSYPWQSTAGNSAAGIGSASGDVISFEPGAASRLGGHSATEITCTLRADMGDNQVTVVYDARGNGDGKIANCMTGDHENRVTDYTALAVTPKTLKIRQGNPDLPGGRGPLIQENMSATLSCQNDQTVFVPKVYGICSQASNSMRSGNPNSGIYEMETSRTLDTGACSGNGGTVVVMEGNGMRPSHKGNGVKTDGVSFTLNTVEHLNVAYEENPVYTMTTGNYTQICKEQSPTLQARDYKDPPVVSVEQVAVENHQHNGYRKIDIAGTLKSTGGTNGGGSENVIIENRYVVRRLTPTECALLQGFPPDWCANLETPDPTDEEIEWWAGVFETHRKIMGKAKKPKSRNQIIKWLQNPHTDSAEYRAYGNGIALPCVCFVMAGIVWAVNQPQK